MLFKLSLKNIRRSIKDYAIYFCTLIIGVAIFYMFNAIEKQSVMLNVTSSMREIIKLMTNMLSGVSVFVSFILGGLIIYASRFLIKRRNKEFGIYLTLGMGKRKISMILLIETLMIGIISLAVGMVLGVCLSQLMSVLVANMFAADMTKFKFVFSESACIKTIIYFSIMYVFVMVFNTFNISRCKLIELLHAGKKSEKIRMKNPWLCTLIFIISAFALGYAYYLTWDGFAKLKGDFNKIYIPILLGAVSTFFIFWSLSGLIIKLVIHIKGVYYKGLNSFVVRQIVSKINTMVFSMTVICLMLFITVCVLSSALNINNSLKSNLEEATPADVSLQKPVNIQELKSNEWAKGHYYISEVNYNDEQMKSDKDTILEVYKRAGIDIENDFKEYIEFNSYGTKDLLFSDSLGKPATDKVVTGPYLFDNWVEDIIKLSDYNKVAKLYGHKTFELQENEYIIVADFESAIKMRNEALNKGQEIEVFGHTLVPKYNKCQKGFIVLTGGHGNTGYIVVPDSVLEGEIPMYNYIVGNFKEKTDEELVEMDKKIDSIESGDMEDKYITIFMATKLSISEASIGLGAMVTFIGLYLGIIFLISSAAILALKELSESVDNIERYNMLRRLGADEKLIKKALFKQIGIFFLCPVILAGIHSIFGIQVCSFIIETLAAEKLLSSIVTTAGIILLIYGGYFIVTYMCSKGIIRDKR